MRCLVCNAENLEGSAYCDDCGAKLVDPSAANVQLKAPTPPPVAASAPPPAATPPPPAPAGLKCPSCGTISPPGDNFCVNCGTPLSSQQMQPSQLTEAPAIVPTPPSVIAIPQPQAVAKVIIKGSNREVILNKDVFSIGRQSIADGIYPDIDLTQDDPEAYVSRKHARIVKKDGQFNYEDTGSSNGSYINNGPKLAKNILHPLKNNDVLRVGKTELVFIYS